MLFGIYFSYNKSGMVINKNKLNKRYYNNLTITKNNIYSDETKMKKQNFQPHPQPQSCIDLGKYKFIPPSKLLKTKPPTILTPNNASNTGSSGHSSFHVQPLLQSNVNKNKNISSHFHSLMECHSYDEPNIQQQVVKKSSIIKIQQDYSHKIENKQNKQNKQNKKEQKLQRSISNPKLQTSSSSTNSRHTLLSNKMPPIAQIQQSRQTQIQKLTQYIHELQQKQLSNKKQITQLSEHRNQLENKLALSEALINKKNKMLNNQQIKITQLENMVHEKCQQHTLIVDSLKKVIQSQLFKINQLKRKLHRVQKIRNGGATQSMLQQEQISYQDSQDSIHFMRPQMTKMKMIHQELKNIGRDNNKNGKYSRNFRNEETKHNNKEITKENREKDVKIISKILQPSQQREQTDNSQQKQSTTTPDFGARTPSYIKQDMIQEKEQQGQQLQCSIDGDNDIENVNLTLSRISQSVQQDFETSRQNVQIEDGQHSLINKNSTTNTVNTYINQNSQNNNSKITADREYTHQQLLDQIDQYLSKRIVPSQRK